MGLSAAPDPEPCECEPRHRNGGGLLGMICTCECHMGGPLTEATFFKAMTDVWNRGLSRDDPQRKRHLT